MTLQPVQFQRALCILARNLKSVVILCLLLVSHLCVAKAQTSRPPEVNQIFPEHTARDEWQKPVETIEALNLNPGDTVGDIGSGAGYFSGWLSQAVGPKGRVYAIDISEEAIRLLNNKIEFFPIKNIDPVHCTETDLKVAPQTLDLAFMMNVFSVVKFKETMLANVMIALRPRGRLVIIDWRATRDGPPGPPRQDRLHREEVVRLAEKAGFKLVRQPDMLPSQYFLEFAKNPHHRVQPSHH